MTNGSTSYPVVTNQSMVLFSIAGVDGIAYSNSVDTQVVGPVISLVKSADRVRASLGDTFVYTLVAKNSGNTAAELTVYDVLPQGVSFIINSVLKEGMLNPGADPVSGIPMGNILPNTQITLSFQVVVVSLPPTLTLDNKAKCTYSFETSEGRFVLKEMTSNSVRIELIAFQLSTLLAANTPTTFVGDVVTYTLMILNEGIQSLHNIVATISIPEGAHFIHGSVIACGVYYPESDPTQGILLDSLSSGATTEISFRANITEVPITSTLSNKSIVTYEVHDESHQTESNTVVIAVVQPAVTISTKVDLTRAAPGDHLCYECIVRNTGNLAVDAVLMNFIPKGVLYVWDSVHINGVMMKGIRPSEGIPLSTLTANSITIVEFKVTIVASLHIHQVSTIQNEGSIHYTFLLPDGRTIRQITRSNKISTDVLTPHISLEVCNEPTVIETGGLIAFRVTLSNQGNWPAEISLCHLSPEGATLDCDHISIDGIRYTELGIDNTVSLGNVDGGMTRTITYFARINMYLIRQYIKGFLSADYLFSIDGRKYVGEVQSNTYMIIVDEASE